MRRLSFLLIFLSIAGLHAKPRKNKGCWSALSKSSAKTLTKTSLAPSMLLDPARNPELIHRFSFPEESILSSELSQAFHSIASRISPRGGLDLLGSGDWKLNLEAAIPQTDFFLVAVYDYSAALSAQSPFPYQTLRLTSFRLFNKFFDEFQIDELSKINPELLKDIRFPATISGAVYSRVNLLCRKLREARYWKKVIGDPQLNRFDPVRWLVTEARMKDANDFNRSFNRLIRDIALHNLRIGIMKSLAIAGASAGGAQVLAWSKQLFSYLLLPSPVAPAEDKDEELKIESIEDPSLED